MVDKREKICPIPDFSAKADSDTEQLGMEVEFIGQKIVELSRDMNRAREFEKRMVLYDKRECYIYEYELKKRPEQLQIATKFIL